MLILNPEVLWPVIALVIAATLFDLCQRRIPNLLTIPALLAGVLHSGVSGGVGTLSQSLLGILAAASALGLFCYLRAMGLGDLKLCAAIGAWVGLSQMILALLLTALAGGLIAAAVVIVRSCSRERLHSNRQTAAISPRGSRYANAVEGSIPYAPAIAIGTIFSFFGRP